MAKNPCGKMRKPNQPYEVWESFDGTWEWHVLKKYQNPVQEAKNPFARWFCAVKSPHTYGGFEMGDVYVSEIKSQARLRGVLVDGNQRLKAALDLL